MVDILIQNARVMDPETGFDQVCSVAVQEGVILQVGGDVPARQVIDGRGCVLSPGFIDIHAHEDATADEAEYFSLPTQTAQCAMRQGVTTLITGNCGLSVLPAPAYQRALEEAPPPIYTPYLVGNVSMRHRVGLDNYTPASPDQIARMVSMEREAFGCGALGVSFGLQYAPGTSREELTALCAEAARAGKFMSVHMRYDFPELALEGVREVIRAAEETGVSLQISHIAANVYGGDHLIQQAARLMEESSADIACDTYPYNAWATGIQSAVFDDGFDNFNFGVEDLEILTGPHAGEYCTPALFEQLRRGSEDCQVACHNAMPMEDVEFVYTLPYSMMGSDAEIRRTPDGSLHGHPRGAAGAVTFLSEFVRDKGLLSLRDGLAKLTVLPAKKAGLASKGRLRAGMDADLVLFDYQALKANARFGVDVCGLPPTGIRAVIAGGRVVHEG